MPARIRFALAGPRPESQFTHGRGLRAVVFGWLAAADAEAATAIHDANQPKPLTIGPLWEDARGLHFEVSALHDWVVAMIERGTARSSGRLTLGRCDYTVTDAAVVGSHTWADLLDEGDALRRFVHVEVITPAAHHAGGTLRRSVPLPAPDLYFASWLGRWRLCAPRPLPDDALATAAERMAVAEFTGGTQAVRLEPSRVFVGFRGRVRFELLGAEDVPRAVRQALGAAALLGGYAGVGVETMRGMGQVRVRLE